MRNRSATCPLHAAACRSRQWPERAAAGLSGQRKLCSPVPVRSLNDAISSDDEGGSFGEIAQQFSLKLPISSDSEIGKYGETGPCALTNRSRTIAFVTT